MEDQQTLVTQPLKLVGFATETFSQGFYTVTLTFVMFLNINDSTCLGTCSHSTVSPFLTRHFQERSVQ